MTTNTSSTSAPPIILMGTPTFAVGTLNALVEAGMNVVAVVTAPDRPAGRGLSLRMSAVKERALELGLPVLQPERLKDPAFLEQLDHYHAVVNVVVAFRMLPEVVWARPALGTINLHASLLPQYRGAAPINWAIMNGERTSGVTTFRIQQAIDTGDLLLQERMDIGPEETAGELHDRMMHVGAALMVRTLQGLFSGTLTAHPQVVEGTIHEAPKLNASTGHIDPQRSAIWVHDRVRGLSPYPSAWCSWKPAERAALQMKVYRTRVVDVTSTAEAGTVRIEGDRILLRCAEGWLELLELQPEGRKRMSAAEFVRGLQVRTGIRILSQER
jgi:methionyl-tRNA formyltransferase